MVNLVCRSEMKGEPESTRSAETAAMLERSSGEGWRVGEGLDGAEPEPGEEAALGQTPE